MTKVCARSIQSVMILIFEAIDPDWVHEQALAAHIRQFEIRKEELQERLERARRKEEELKRKAMAKVIHKRQVVFS